MASIANISPQQSLQVPHGPSVEDWWRPSLCCLLSWCYDLTSALGPRVPPCGEGLTLHSVDPAEASCIAVSSCWRQMVVQSADHCQCNQVYAWPLVSWQQVGHSIKRLQYGNDFSMCRTLFHLVTMHCFSILSRRWFILVLFARGSSSLQEVSIRTLSRETAITSWLVRRFLQTMRQHTV